MNKDRLNSVAPIRAIQQAYAVADRLQDMPSEEQVVALAVAFQLYAEVLRLDPSELLNKAQRIVNDGDTHYTREAKALRDYVQQEVK